MGILPSLVVFLFVAAQPSAVAVDTPLAPEPGVTLDIDTFGLPSSLTILEGERKKEDLEQKRTAKSKLIFATREYFAGNFDTALEHIHEGLQMGFYPIQFKRLESRVHYMAGQLEQAIVVAGNVAEDSLATDADHGRLNYLKSVERYLRLSLETHPLSYRYAAVIKGDQKVPYRFITPVGLDVDRFGRIIQTSFGTDEVVVFSKGLEYLMKLSGIPNPFDVAVDPDGLILVTSFGGDRVFRFSREGALLGTFGRKGSGPGEFFGPEGLVIAPDRYIFVIDSGNHRVQKFSPDGKYLMEFGGRGPKAGQFLSPRAILLETYPGNDTYTLLVMCQGDFGPDGNPVGQILQRFDPYGNFLGIVPTGRLTAPRDIDWFGRHEFLFATADGKIQALEEGSDTLRTLVDEFDAPFQLPGLAGLAMDEEAGLIYISDQTASELRVLRPSTNVERTMLNVSDLDFDHYPYIGLTIQVTTGEGEPVTGLSRRNFAVEEETHRAQLISVRPITQTGPMQLIVHLDASSALDRRSILVKSFLSDLSRTLPAGSLLSVRKGPEEILEVTDNPYKIRKSLDGISRRVDGFLTRDIHHSIEAFKERGRRNLVVVTTREHDLAVDHFANLYLHLANHGISLFVVHLQDRQLPVMKTLCRRTGGIYRRLLETSIEDFAFQVASSKTASYFLVYASPYGKLQPSMSMDVVVKLFYLTDFVSDNILYYAP